MTPSSLCRRLLSEMDLQGAGLAGVEHPSTVLPVLYPVPMLAPPCACTASLTLKTAQGSVVPSPARLPRREAPGGPGKVSACCFRSPLAVFSIQHQVVSALPSQADSHRRAEVCYSVGLVGASQTGPEETTRVQPEPERLFIGKQQGPLWREDLKHLGDPRVETSP